MLSTIFIYIKTLQQTDIQNIFSPEQFSSLYNSFIKKNIMPYFLLPSNITNFIYPKISFDLQQLDYESLLPFFSHMFEQLKIKKEQILLLSDCKQLLNFGKDINVPCVGFMSNTEFLPVSYCFESFENLHYTYFLNIWKRTYNLPITIATTKNLIIREFTMEDMPALFSMYQDSNNTRFLFQREDNYKHLCDKYSAYIKEIYPFYEYGLWAVIHKETGKLIGEFGLQNNVIDKQEEIELGYFLHPYFQKKGYATEAIHSIFRYGKSHLGFQRIVAIIHPNNTASLKTAKRCGMHFEKKILQNSTEVSLYAINLKNNNLSAKQVTAKEIGKKVYDIYQKNPDTNVYGKRFHQNL